MSKRKPATPPAGLTAEILSHRHEFERFVLEQAEPWHREHLGRLFKNWRDWNGKHFESRLEPPYLVLSEPAFSRAYGCCRLFSSFGSRSEIRIRPSLIHGLHPAMVRGEEFAEGRQLFVDDVLLHEMIHQWQFEILGDWEPAYHGHGPLFRDVANRIGEVLGLSKVRDCKQRGKDVDLPSCAQWPHCVRSKAFYLGAYRPRRQLPNTLEGMISRWLINRLKSVDYQAAFDELKEAVEAAIGNTLSGDSEPASSRKHCGKSVSIPTL